MGNAQKNSPFIECDFLCTLLQRLVAITCMHICFIGEFPHQGQPVGGISMYIRNTANLLVENGHRVTVLSFSESVQGWEQQSPFALYRVHPKKWKWLNFLRIAREQHRVLKQLHAAHPIDAVETPESGLCFLPKIPGIRYIIRLHGGHMFFAKALGLPMKNWPTWQEIQSFKKADVIVGVSAYVLAQTQPYLPAEVATKVIFNGVNTQLFSPVARASSVFRDIVFVGWLVPKKGPAFLMQAFQKLAAEFADIRLHFYGRDTQDENGQSYWSSLSSPLPAAISNHVFFHGNVPNEQLPQIIGDAYCCVYPSQMEAMPVAWLEVLACGQLLIAGDAGPAKEIIQHGVTGLLCKPTDAEEIATQLRWALQHSEEVQQIREKARETAVQKFSLNTVLQQNLQLWKG